MDITTSEVFSVIDWNYYFWNQTRWARSRVCKPKLRQERISSMLVEFWYLAVLRTMLKNLDLDCKFLKEFDLIIIRTMTNGSLLMVQTQLGLSSYNMVIQINSQAHIKSFKHWLWRSQYFYLQYNAACKRKSFQVSIRQKAGWNGFLFVWGLHMVKHDKWWGMLSKFYYQNIIKIF